MIFIIRVAADLDLVTISNKLNLYAYVPRPQFGHPRTRQRQRGTLPKGRLPAFS